MRARSLGLEDPLEEAMTTHSSNQTWQALVHRVAESDTTEVT